MLRAALLDEAAARAAFADWLTTNPPDDPMAFDVAERRLLPLLAANLRTLGISHPIQGAGESVGKQSAARNTQLMQAAGDAVSRLAKDLPFRSAPMRTRRRTRSWRFVEAGRRERCRP